MRIHMSSDEVNLLIHRYLLENGFLHSAFSFSAEAAIQRNPFHLSHAEKLPPNALITLLQKALLFIYIEYHTEDESGRGIPCEETFSFFKRHECWCRREGGAVAAGLLNDDTGVAGSLESVTGGGANHNNSGMTPKFVSSTAASSSAGSASLPFSGGAAGAAGLCHSAGGESQTAGTVVAARRSSQDHSSSAAGLHNGSGSGSVYGGAAIAPAASVAASEAAGSGSPFSSFAGGETAGAGEDFATGAFRLKRSSGSAYSLTADSTTACRPASQRGKKRARLTTRKGGAAGNSNNNSAAIGESGSIGGAAACSNEAAETATTAAGFADASVESAEAVAAGTKAERNAAAAAELLLSAAAAAATASPSVPLSGAEQGASVVRQMPPDSAAEQGVVAIDIAEALREARCRRVANAVAAAAAAGMPLPIEAEEILIGPPAHTFEEEVKLKSFFRLMSGDEVQEAGALSEWSPADPELLVTNFAGGSPWLYRLPPSTSIEKPVDVYPKKELTGPRYTATGSSNTVNAGSSAHWRSDGQLLATGYESGDLGVWTCEGVLLAALSVSSTSVICTAFSTSGNYLAAACADGTVVIWQALRSSNNCNSTGEAGSQHRAGVDDDFVVAHTYRHRGGVIDIDWSGDNVLASGSIDGCIVVSDFSRSLCHVLTLGMSSISGSSRERSSSRLNSNGSSSTTSHCGSTTSITADGVTSSSSSCSDSSSGGSSSSSSSAVKAETAANGAGGSNTLLNSVSMPLPLAPPAAAAAAGETNGGFAAFWQLPIYPAEPVNDQTEPVREAKTAPSFGATAPAAGGSSNEKEEAAAAVEGVVTAGEVEIASLRWDGKGRYLAIVDSSSIVKLWQLEGPQERFVELSAHTEAVIKAEWREGGPHDNQQFLITVAMDRYLLLWDLEKSNRTPIKRLGYGCPPTSMRISRDGSRLAVGTYDSVLHIYALPSLTEVASLLDVNMIIPHITWRSTHDTVAYNAFNMERTIVAKFDEIEVYNEDEIAA